MKLKNKRTGEITNFVIDRDVIKESYLFGKTYHSLAELSAEWEDVPEEPKKWYTINTLNGSVQEINDDKCTWTDKEKECIAELGFRFETKEEVELAVCKLKAWKRLKDHGFRFKNCHLYDANNIILFSMPMRAEVVDDDELYGVRDDYAEEDKKDLALLFGGGE